MKNFNKTKKHNNKYNKKKRGGGKKKKKTKDNTQKLNIQGGNRRLQLGVWQEGCSGAGEGWGSALISTCIPKPWGACADFVFVFYRNLGLSAHLWVFYRNLGLSAHPWVICGDMRCNQHGNDIISYYIILYHIISHMCFYVEIIVVFS